MPSRFRICPEINDLSGHVLLPRRHRDDLDVRQLLEAAEKLIESLGGDAERYECRLGARPGLGAADVPAKLQGHRADLCHDDCDVVDFQADLAGLDDALLDRGEVPAGGSAPFPPSSLVDSPAAPLGCASAPPSCLELAASEEHPAIAMARSSRVAIAWCCRDRV